jgi:Flp pilus assembly pilin Flp
MQDEMSGSIRQLRRCEEGATAIEFAMISPVLFLLMIGVVELGLVLAAQNIMESATFSASRLGKTGYIESGKTQEEMITEELSRMSSVLLDPSRIVVTSLSYADYADIGEPEPYVDANGNGQRDNGENYTDINSNGQYDLDRGRAGYGTGGSIVVYTMTYPWRLFTPMVSNLLGEDGAISLRARAVVKNEPF